MQRDAPEESGGHLGAGERPTGLDLASRPGSRVWSASGNNGKPSERAKHNRSQDMSSAHENPSLAAAADAESLGSCYSVGATGDGNGEQASSARISRLSQEIERSEIWQWIGYGVMKRGCQRGILDFSPKRAIPPSNTITSPSSFKTHPSWPQDHRPKEPICPESPSINIKSPKML